MLSSYLKAALRYLITQKLHSAINVFGLAIGLASFVLIALFVRHELGYDGFFANAERIYRISRDYYASGGAPNRVPASNNAPVAPALLEEFPQIEQTARIMGGRALLERGNDTFSEDGFAWADGTLFEIFDFDWQAGNAATALEEPRSVVLTQSIAAKYFGSENPLGRALVMANPADGSDVPLTVTGVIADLPANTHLSFTLLTSLSTLPALFGTSMLEQWNSSTDYHTYFLLREGASVEDVRSRIPEFLNRRIAPEASSQSGMTIMNVRDIHTRSTRDEEWKPSGNIATIYGFSAIAVLIVLIACINFMNLATARSANRAKEVGVRKTLGATRRQIAVQFLCESVLTAIVAMFIAAIVVELALPAYRVFIDTPLELRYFGEGGIAPMLASVALLVGLFAGSYPALYLSAFSPGKVLKADRVRGSGGVRFRNVLVIAQFTIAIALLIGTAVVQQQTAFARGLDLGFNKDQVVVLQGSVAAGLGPQWPAMRQQLEATPGVVSVTASHYTPFSWDDNRWTVRPRGSSEIRRIQYMAVDYDFFETYEIDVLAGRSFSRDFGGDALHESVGAAGGPFIRVVINESAARLLGWSTNAAVSETIELARDAAFGSIIPVQVVGVVRDTHFESVTEPVRPMIYTLVPVPVQSVRRLSAAALRVAGTNLPATLERIDAAWREFIPDQPIARRFLDQDFEALYRSEERRAQMLAYFSALAVAVACLGLLGLAWFATERRTKEIGIRKVVGGSVWDVVRLFTGEFSRLVLLANLIAWPLAYFAMQRWLSGFAYRTELGLLPFVGAALVALLVACVTVAAVAARAAAAKPLHALRYE